MYGCHSAITCINLCQTSACQQNCVSRINTPNGQAEMTALMNCLKSDCPNTGGGYCDDTDPNFDPSICTLCLQQAQVPGGNCYAYITLCSSDG